MQSIEKMLNDGTFDSITKKERLTLARDKDKMEKVLGGIAQLGRVPAALFLIDIGHEHIALAEAKKLGHHHVWHGGYEFRSEQGGFCHSFQ